MHLLIDLQSCQTGGSRHRGIGRYSLALARAMAQEGSGRHRISLLLSDRFPDTVAGLRAAFSPLVGDDNIHVMALPAPCREVDPAHFARLRMAEAMRLHFIRELAPDCVHVSSLFEGLADDAVCSIEPAAADRHLSAVTLYDLIPYLNPEIYLADANVRRWYLRRLQFLKNADRMLAISESSRREALEVLGLAPERVVNISSAIEGHFRPLELAPQERQVLLERYAIRGEFVLYTGGMDHRKNIEGLIQAYAQLPVALRSRHQLVVVCSVDAHGRDRLQQLARRQGLQPDELVLTGFVAEQDLVALYNLARLFVFPSLHEGFGLPVLEAMACGTPAIGSDRTSIPEVLGLADAMFDPTRPEAIAAAMARALGDDGFLRRLSEHGLVQSGKFSWQASARLALDALEEDVERRTGSAQSVAAPRPAGRPRLAYVSPLPPQTSGIADYSAHLLPELARHYEIELVCDEAEISDAWLRANFPLRSIEWFERNAGQYQRVLYHMGNSAFHVHMLRLLRHHPGVVMLHDYCLSGMLHFAQVHDQDRLAFHMGLFRSHGYKALQHYQRGDVTATIMAHSANRQVLDSALGVMVHSRHSIERARQDYGDCFDGHLVQVPFAHPPRRHIDRAEARRRLGVAPYDYLVCSFGFMAPSKLNGELLAAWLQSGLAASAGARLVFAGQGGSGEHGKAMQHLLADCPNASVTGYIETDSYADWLAAADVGVQLRTNSRGETSAAIFDCLTQGLALVYNAHGTAAELPPDVGARLRDGFEAAELAATLLRLRTEPAWRQQLMRAGQAYVSQQHDPALVARRYREAIETFYETAPARRELVFFDELAARAHASGALPLSPEELGMLAACSTVNRRHHRTSRLVVDIGDQTAEQLGSWLPVLLDSLPTAWQLECVRRQDGGWRTDRASACAALRLDIELPEEDCLALHQDVWLGWCDQAAIDPGFALHARRSAGIDLGMLAAPHSIDWVGVLRWAQAGGFLPPGLIERSVP